MTVGDMLTRNAAKFPGKTAIVQEEGPSLTYADLNDRVNRLASSLIRLGLKKGDRMASWSTTLISSSSSTLPQPSQEASSVPITII